MSAQSDVFSAVFDHATQADFNRDGYGFEKDVRQSGYYGGGLSGAIEMKSFYGRCMVADGYTARQQ